MALLEAEYGMTEMAMNSSRYHGDEHLAVRFYAAPKQNMAKSQEENRPVWEDTDYIEIVQPGNKESIVRRPATDRDKQRFARHWQMYEARITQSKIEGTMLEEWPAITRSQVEELKFLNVRTVEQLANLSDANAQNIMGVSQLKSKARKFLETAKEAKAAEALEKQRQENEELRAQMAELQAQMAEIAPPKRKRRTKAEMEADKADEDAQEG